MKDYTFLPISNELFKAKSWEGVGLIANRQSCLFCDLVVDNNVILYDPRFLP